MTTYLLDTNVFIQAKNREYGFDFCPGFWDWIDTANADGRVFSIDSVRDELIGGSDDLADWAKTRHAEFFLTPDSGVVDALRELSEWTTDADYEQVAKSTFLSGADSFLVAHAIAGGHAIVTHERVDNSRKRIKIPEAAIPHSVKCLNPYELLRTEHARFVLGNVT